MRNPKRRGIVIGTTCGVALVVVLGLVTQGSRAVATDAGRDGTIEVALCDGETTVQVAQAGKPTAAEGRQIADELMAKWRASNPGTDWVAEERAKHKIVEPADNRDLVGRSQGQTYGRISEQDVVGWERATLAMATRGSQVFHSADELGSTIAVSCDMCHPDAANTHPETYPKYQVQIGEAVLLRDMVNWCLEHPVRAPRMTEDDPRMRALEAYMIAQRTGTPLSYGKH